MTTGGPGSEPAPSTRITPACATTAGAGSRAASVLPTGRVLARWYAAGSHG